MSSWTWKASLAGLAIVAATASAVAQMGPHGHNGPMHRQMMHADDTHGPMGPHAMMDRQFGAPAQPTMPGQAAFGTIQEIVQILQADPSTDWSRVNIAALRQHLIDMDEVTLRAAADQRALENGIEITVTGEGRTLEAIKRMVPAHARELAQIGWSAKTEDLSNGVKLVVTTGDTTQVAKLKALGFMGLMVQGSHHQPHHLMMAKGELNGH
jgi:hypothetical protein